MDLEKLLKRVKGEDVERSATLDTLQRLCMCFVSNIPYETTDMFGGKRKVWDLEIIYEDIVNKNRGGFCFDLNALLQWVLKQFGFKVIMFPAYFMEKDGRFCETGDHMTLVVTLRNGDQYLTDVGWGGCGFVLPLEMKMGVAQSQPNGVYRLGSKQGFITVEKKKQRYLKLKESVENETLRSIVIGNDAGNEGWNIKYGFTETDAFDFADFQEGHDYAQFKNEDIMTNMLVVVQDVRGRKFFVNNLFYEKEYINPETIKLKRFKKCTVDEMYTILEKEFNLKLDFELKLKNIVE